VAAFVRESAVEAPMPPVSDAELDVLKVLWKSGPATVRQVAGRLPRRRRRLAYNTILTLLSRLREKGYVTADRGGTAHVFRATVTREQLLRHGLTDLAERICDGTRSTLVHALVEGQRFSPQEIEGFRRLVEQLEPKNVSED